MSKRVIIVDDSAFMRNMLKDILQGAGHTVVGEAETGRAAIEQYQRLKPDLVTMDMVMPEMNGIDAVKEILKHDPHAAIAMVSAMGQQGLVDEALSAGAKTFIVKPFQPEEVIKTIQTMFGAA